MSYNETVLLDFQKRSVWILMNAISVEHCKGTGPCDKVQSLSKPGFLLYDGNIRLSRSEKFNDVEADISATNDNDLLAFQIFLVGINIVHQVKDRRYISGFQIFL